MAVFKGAGVAIVTPMKDNGEVMGRVEKLAWDFNPKTLGYDWNEKQCQDYQRHTWNTRGYQVLRPVVKL